MLSKNNCTAENFLVLGGICNAANTTVTLDEVTKDVIPICKKLIFCSIAKYQKAVYITIKVFSMDGQMGCLHNDMTVH